MSRAPLYVTRPLLPPLDEFRPWLESIWHSGQVTNNGPYHDELECALAAHLGVEHLSLFANGTLALMTALKALGLGGEVITTPYSFVATTHALGWCGLTPVFADIDPATLNLRPDAVEAAITPATRAILPVHVYGTPCDTAALWQIAALHRLALVYDAAHAFGVADAGGSLLRHGDLSVLSFHATKVFHTFEGGAVVCRDAAIKRELDLLKNFGFVDETTVVRTGINAKMDELRAAFGLLQLRHVDAAIEARRQIDAHYRAHLAGLSGLRCLQQPAAARSNHGYFPVFIDGGRALRDAVAAHLREHDVMARRYFHPLISDFPMYAALPSAAPARLPVARQAADSVLCLPIHPQMSADDCAHVAALLAEALGQHAADARI